MAFEVLPLTSIGIIILIAIGFSIFVKKMGQNAVIGFILAGFVLGPFGLHFLNPNDALISAFSELGLFILLFYLGIELSIKDFLEYGPTTFGLAIIDMICLTGLGVLVMLSLGFSLLFALVVGIILCSTSTAIVGKFILDKGIMKQTAPKHALSVLILQDFLGIILLVLITSSASKGSTIGLAMTALVFASAAFFAVHRLSRIVEDWLVANGFGHLEMTLYAIGIGLLTATAGSILGLTTAIGAYFAGFALAETRAGHTIKKDVGFLRDFFLVFFFVGFGTTLFFDKAANALALPGLHEFLFLVGIVIALVVGALIIHAVVFNLFGSTFGLNREDSTLAAILLTPLGEFVVIIATVATASLALKEIPTLSPLAFLLIIATLFLFQPLYNARRLHQKVFSFLPNVFGKPVLKSRVKPSTPYTERLIKQITYNLFVIICFAWIAALLYQDLPRFGVPILYSRQITTAIIFAFFASAPFVTILRSAKSLFSFITKRHNPE